MGCAITCAEQSEAKVSLFNVTLRTIFCFTRDMWHTGEDNGFHKMDKSTFPRIVSGRAELGLGHVLHELYGFVLFWAS